MKKTLTLALAALLLFSFAANLVFADEISAPTETDVSSELIDSGVWGDNISWTLTDDGLLSVSGFGEFPVGISPWAQYYNSDISEAYIFEGITSIGESAFAKCFNLEYVYIPDSVEYISESAFIGCDFNGWLTFVCSEGSYAERYAIERGILIFGKEYLPIAEGMSGNIEWSLETDGILYINGSGDIPDYIYELTPWYEYSGQIKTVCIGDEITGIGEFAFQYCTNLKEIHIPESVKFIKDSAFFDLYFDNLLIYCEENTAAEIFAVKNSIPAEVMRYDTSGKIGDNITWTIKDEVLELTGKGKMQDYYSFNLRPDRVKKIIVKDGITSIGNDSFSYFFNVTEVELADSIKKIGYNAFYMCQSLEKITLPKSLESIGEYSFSECSSLKEIDFPEKLEKIEKHAFAFCISLEKVRLLSEVERIDDEAFMVCEKLNEIFIPSQIKRLGKDIFSGCNENLVIHGLKDSKIEKYAKENGFHFEEIDSDKTDKNEDAVAVIKPDIPTRELTAAEKVLDTISDYIVLIFCGLCVIVAAVVALIFIIKIKSAKKEKTTKKQDETKK